MPRAGDAVLEVSGADGRLLWKSEPSALPAGKSQITWDGRSSTGDRVPSGVYFVRLVAHGVGADSRRIVLVR
jgi:flagellar hook assembly protein FlgD